MHSKVHILLIVNDLCSSLRSRRLKLAAGRRTAAVATSLSGVTVLHDSVRWPRRCAPRHDAAWIVITGEQRNLATNLVMPPYPSRR